MDPEKEVKEREARRDCYKQFAQGLMAAVIFPDSAHREIVTITERGRLAYINGVQFAFWLINRRAPSCALFRGSVDLQHCLECFAEGFSDAVNGKRERRRISWPNLANKRMGDEDFAAWQQVNNAYNNGLMLAEHMAYGPIPGPIRICPETGMVC